jgi:arginine:agmatine antiporter
LNDKRKIGLPLATILVAGNMIGSGVYMLPASLAAFGSSTLIAWAIALVGALLLAFVLAYLGSIAPAAGGLCGYATQAFGRFAGFQSNTFYWLCAWIGNVAIAVAAIGYLAKVLPWFGSSDHLAVGVVALIWLTTLLNIFGARIACQVQSLTFFLGVIPIGFVAVMGWWWFDADVFAASWNVSGKPLGAMLPEAVLLVFWAFSGLESASVGTGVVENPARNVPLATLGGVAIAGLFYIAASAAIMGMIPAAKLMTSTAPFADAAQVMVGSIAGSLVAVLAFIKATGTLSGFVLVTAQVGKGAAEQGFFPAMFASTDARDVPIKNLLLMAAVMSVATLLTISPTLNQQFNKLSEMSVLLLLLSYMYACIAVWRYPTLTKSKVNAARLAATLAALFCSWVFLASGITPLASVACGVAILSSFYFLIKPDRHRST